MGSLITELKQDSDEFKNIGQAIRQSALTKTRDKIWRWGRVQKEIKENGWLKYFTEKLFDVFRWGGLLNYGAYQFIQAQFMQNEFSGKEEVVTIKQVLRINNEVLKKNYAIKMEKLSNTYQSHTKYPYPGITVKNLTLKQHAGEAFLLHGTSTNNANLIAKNGFKPELCTYAPLRGYGALGKGVYFSDEMSKAAIYSSCQKCCQFRCNHVGNLNGDHFRTVVLSRVVLGNTLLQRKKVSLRENLPDGYHSVSAIPKDKDNNSEFESREYLINNSNQICPEYVIRYSFQKNLIHYQLWKNASARFGLFFTSRPPILLKLDECVKQLEQKLILYEEKLDNIEINALCGCIDKTKEFALFCLASTTVSKVRHAAIQSLIGQLDDKLIQFQSDSKINCKPSN